VCFGAACSAVIGLACIGNILYWRHLEESALESRYAEDYRRYRRTTWLGVEGTDIDPATRGRARALLALPAGGAACARDGGNT
jgi:hypothetical protein